MSETYDAATEIREAVKELSLLDARLAEREDTMSETYDAATEIREVVKELSLTLREQSQRTRGALAEIRDMLSLIQHNLKRYSGDCND